MRLLGVPPALVCGLWIASGASATSASAEDAQATDKRTIEEITVIGTRNRERSASNLAVPVDVLDSRELLRQGDSRMDSMLTRIIPSLNVSQEPISDDATFVRPVTLRGLPPDSTLVLLNGKRRHRSSVIPRFPVGGTAGSHGVDVSSIPAIALDRVEILRDGAAAQYGSDAVAGIINFVLRDAASGASVETRFGQYYEGDGDDVMLAANVGLPLAERGFLNLSAEYNASDPTSRSIQIDHARTQIDAGNTHVGNPAQIWGAPEIGDNRKLFANAGVDVGDAHQAYAFGGYSQRTVTGGYYWRDPLNRSGVFTDGWPHWGDPEAFLVLDHAPLDGVDCPSITGAYAAKRIDPAQLAAVEADPNCFAFQSVFPGGFRPHFSGDIKGHSGAFGIRGELPGGTTYDFSAVFGTHEVDFTLADTVNPQLALLEARIPTTYRLGGQSEQDVTVNADLTRLVDFPAFHSPLNVAFGIEYRVEEFEVKPGELNSWMIDYINRDGTDFDETSIDLSAVGCQAPEYIAYLDRIARGELRGRYQDGVGAGSNGAPGFRPDPCAPDANDRSSYAAYLDLEGNVSERLLVGLAGRFENPQGFDSNADAKASARIAVSDALALRGSAGTGFRVPTVGQATLRKIEGALTDGRLVDVLLLSPSDPLLSEIAEPLQEESSVSFGLGAVMNVGELRLSADYYHIAIDDRISIVNGGSIDCLLLARDGLLGGGTCDDALASRADELAAIKDGLRSSVPAIHSISAVDWFANDFDTTTRGLDVVATWPARMFGGSTLFTLAMNHNTTEVDAVSPNSPLAGADNLHVLRIEEGTPQLRVSLSADHQAGPFRVLARVRHYDGHTDIHAIDWHVQEMGEQTLVDLEVTYDVTDHIALVAGADNLFDTEADRIGLDWTGDVSSFGIMFPESAPFDTNGGFYYVKAIISM